jgi:hypothetical protein
MRKRQTFVPGSSSWVAMNSATMANARAVWRSVWISSGIVLAMDSL